MPELSYKPLCGLQLDGLFRTLVQTGLSAFAARTGLTDWIERGNFEVTPPLPRGWRLCLLDDGGIAIETADGDLDATKFFVSQTESSPIPVPRLIQAALDVANDRRRTVAAFDATYKVKDPKAVPTDDAGLTVRARKKVQAKIWLMERLKQDKPPGTFADYKAGCMENFKLSGRDYKAVWDAAHEEPGVPPATGFARRKNK